MKHNIVLTGIMGCGKTTIGKIVSEKLNMRFIDIDEYIEQMHGKISEIFLKGEDYFRNIEHNSVLDISKMHNVVIATGGGVVKRQDNINALKENGIIFFVDRPLDNILEDIDISERPLLKNGKKEIIKIFNERYPLYKRTCDIHIVNTTTLNDAASSIIESWLSFYQ